MKFDTNSRLLRRLFTPRKKNEEAVVKKAIMEATNPLEAPAKKTRMHRAKKETFATETPVCKLLAPRKKAVVPCFIILNSVDDSIIYTSVVEKVQTAISIHDVSLDIYVKAEEGKAYYIMNGEVVSTVDHFGICFILLRSTTGIYRIFC